MITALTAIAAVLPGCQPPDRKGKIEIELVQYKPEAVEVFEMLEHQNLFVEKTSERQEF